MSTDSVEVTDDLSAQMSDRLAHAKQYLDEVLPAVRDAIELLQDEDEEAAEPLNESRGRRGPQPASSEANRGVKV